MKELHDTVALARSMAMDDGLELIALDMHELMCELVAITSMTSQLIASMPIADIDHEELAELHLSARMAIAKLERLGHHAPKLGLA